MKLIPTRNKVAVVISGHEPNGYMTSIILCQLGRKVHLITNEVELAERIVDDIFLNQAPNNQQVELTVIRKHSLPGVFHLLSSRFIVHTHGFGGGVSSIGKRKILNVWHGDGPKENLDLRHFGKKSKDDFLLIGDKFYINHKIRSLQYKSMPTLLVAPNPRVALFSEAANCVKCNELSQKNIVLWAPTKAGSLDEFLERLPNGKNTLEFMLAEFAKRDLTLVYRDHPASISKMAFLTEDFRILTQTYDPIHSMHLTSSARALITDYSSILSDFEYLGRPIGVFAHDLETKIERGLVTSQFKNKIESSPSVFLLSSETVLIDFLNHVHLSKISDLHLNSDFASQFKDALLQSGFLRVSS